MLKNTNELSFRTNNSSFFQFDEKRRAKNGQKFVCGLILMKNFSIFYYNSSFENKRRGAYFKQGLILKFLR